MNFLLPIERSTVSRLIVCTLLVSGCSSEDNFTSVSPVDSNIPKTSPTTPTDDNPVVAEKPDTTDKNNSKASAEKQNASPTAQKHLMPTGVFSGSIKLVGEFPEISAFELPENLLAICGPDGVIDESLVINRENRGIANVFVYMQDAPDSIDHIDFLGEPVTYQQKVCQFIPHAMFLPVGSKINAINSDVLAHNIHTYPIRNEPVNILLNAKDTKGVHLHYPESEILPHKIGCDLHPWMTAWHLVLDHPYAAVTNENGEFAITHLPPGEHKFRIWQERVGYLEKDYMVIMQAGEKFKLSFEYSADKFTKED